MNFKNHKIICSKCGKDFELKERMYSNWEIDSPDIGTFYCNKCSIPYRMIYALKGGSEK